MNKHLFNLAFVTGAAAIIWVGLGFIDSSALAMAMTAVIFVVYLAGAMELYRFRQASISLTTALSAIPEGLSDLNGFLSGVHGSLQHPVRLRIEGERAGLPGPSMTPYLVGLLVMLGMLGTFLGMVVTLKGAVFTLEKTADLAAMRSALAVPVKGLGLAFGTSVAGVAASAVLGLMSALCRRERLQAGQLLDAKAASVLSGFSHARQREQTFRALQSQSEALPQVVDKLQAMMLQMEARSEQLNQRLLANQEQFNKGASETYTELARSVEQSLRESLASSAQAAGESIKPVFESAMQGIAQEARVMHERTAGTVQQQLDGLADRFSVATASVAQTWNAALDNQKQANAGMADQMGRSLEAFSASFDQRAGALVATVGDAYTGLQAGQMAQDAQRQQAWTQSLETMANNLARELQDSGAQVLAQQREVSSAVTHAVRELAEQVQADAGKSLADTTRLIATAEDLMRTRITSEAQWLDQHRERVDQLAGLVKAEEEQRQQVWKQSLDTMATTLTRELQDSGNKVLAQQSEICTAVTHAMRELTDQARADAGKSLADTARLVTTAEDMMRTRVSSEAQWLDQHRERMEQLSGLIQTDDEQRQKAWKQSLDIMAATLARELQNSGAQVLAQQREICTTVTDGVRQLADQAQATAGQSLEETARLVTTAEGLMQSRIQSESQWLDQHRERMDQMAGLLQASDEQRQQAWTQSLETMAATLTRELQESGAQVLAQQREICIVVTDGVRELADQAQSAAGKSLTETARLVTTAEDLMRSRITSEAQWLDQHSARMDQLAGLLQTELGALREQEAARGDAAVAHLGELQSTVTTHLTTLGTALEAPIARLIETAAEAPRAAADVIGQMREEISHSAARDNALLEERGRIMETLNALLDVINHASHEQRAVIDSLVASSSEKLDVASTAFSANIADEAEKLSEIAASVTTSAVDVASLAEAFGVAVQSFNAANEKLASNLDRIEVALDKSMTRSDGQLAYYVAQAREIIDLSMSSQKEIVEGLRQLPAMQADEAR